MLKIKQNDIIKILEKIKELISNRVFYDTSVTYMSMNIASTNQQSITYLSTLYMRTPHLKLHGSVSDL